MDDIVMEIVQEKFDRRLKEAVEREGQKELNNRLHKKQSLWTLFLSFRKNVKRTNRFL